jgi:hypothetical protein
VGSLIAWASFVQLPSVVGGLAWSCLGPSCVPARSRWTEQVERGFLAWLSGFALLSAALFARAHVGRLSAAPAAALIAVLAGACLAVGVRRGTLGEALSASRWAVAVAVALALSSSLFATLLPPIDATVAGSDASTYLGLASHLARTGRLSDDDALVAGMTPAEREALFTNRFAGDRTGPYARFPGGVALTSPAGDTVQFHFFRLFPVWLAAGLETVGEALYLRQMSLFATVGLVSLFVVGRRIGGATLGLVASALLACFYPQAFFSRFPMSEMLAQALFLSGLAALVGAEGCEQRRYTHLAGWLLGALCLCRVDALPFVALGLAATSLLPAGTGVRPRDWVVPAATAAAFASAALVHQLATSIHYVGALPHGRPWAAAGALLWERPWVGGLGVALVAAAGVLVARAEGRGSATAVAVSRCALVLVSGAFLAVFLLRTDARLVGRSFLWLAMYATPGVLGLLGAGVALTLACGLRGPGVRGTWLALSFLAAPAFCLWADPRVVPLQPWAMRRFVPMVLPLLFLVAARGWQAGLRRVLGPAPATLLLVGLSLAAASAFVPETSRLASRPGEEDTAATVHALAEVLPEGALVLVPDSSAGLHVQIPLEYARGRDVLLLPLAEGAAAHAWDVARLYLARQIASGRRVCLLLPRPIDLAGSLLRDFDVEPLGEATLSFERVLFAGPDTFPDPPERVSMRSRVLDVRRPAATARVVRVGDPREDVRILVSGFHAPEAVRLPGEPVTTFRWTGLWPGWRSRGTSRSS